MENSGYCCRCKCERTMTGAHTVKTTNGRNCLKGTCSSCQTKMCKFIK